MAFALFAMPPALAAQVETASGADAAPGFSNVRAELRNEYVDLQGGGRLDLLVPRVDIAAVPDLSLRIELPIVFADSGVPGAGREAGLGDILIRASYRAARGPGYALVAGSELMLDTATKPSLGTGHHVIAPLVFAAIDVPQRDSVVFPLLQHFVGMDGDASRRDVRYTSLRSAVLSRWQHLIYSVVEPQFIVDHVGADKAGATLEAEIGRFLNRDTALWIRPGIGLFGDDLPQVYDWKIALGVRFFPR